MLIVLDTNVLVSEIPRKLASLHELAEYCNSVRAGLFLPEVVETELFAHLKRDVHERQSAMEKALSRLPPEFKHVFDSSAFTAQVDQLEKELRSSIDQLVETHKLSRISISEDASRLAVRRSAERRPPCDVKGEEIRDAMIWEAALNLLSTHGGPLVLVSNDKRAFGSEELGEEVKEQGARLLTYSSIASLLSENVPADPQPQNTELSDYISPDLTIDLIAAFIAYDPSSEWESAVSNIIDVVLDLFLHSYTFVGVSDLRLKSGFRRPSSYKKHNHYLVFEAVVSIDAETSAWELRDANPDEPLDDVPDEFRDIIRMLPQKVLKGECATVQLEFDVLGELVVPIGEMPKAEDAYIVELEASNGGIKGKERWSKKIDFGLPKPMLTERTREA